MRKLLHLCYMLVNALDIANTVKAVSLTAPNKQHANAMTTMSQKSATAAENGETTATVAEFGDSRTFLRQCGQVLITQKYK